MHSDTNNRNDRLDVFIAEKEGISRILSKDIIEKGFVAVNGKTVTKNGFKLKGGEDISVEYKEKMFVGRGGFKLQYAIEKFGIDLNDAVCLDVGAGAGGFTDCMLQNGAAKVYALDAGSNQLKDAIRSNKKVIPMENTDIRGVSREMFESLNFATVDLSFISLEKIAAHLYGLLGVDSKCVMLIKPQFEAGPGVVGKNGVIKTKKIHYKTLIKVYNFITREKFSVLGLCSSPIKGGDGNREFLLYTAKDNSMEGMDMKGFDKEAFNAAFTESEI